MEKWKRLVAARKKAKMTQEQLARICGVTLATYNRWETLKFQPNINQLKSISNTLHVSVDWLLYNDPISKNELDHTFAVLAIAEKVAEWTKGHEPEELPEGCARGGVPGLSKFFAEQLGIDEYYDYAEVLRFIQGYPEDDPFGLIPQEEN